MPLDQIPRQEINRIHVGGPLVSCAANEHYSIEYGGRGMDHRTRGKDPHSLTDLLIQGINFPTGSSSDDHPAGDGWSGHHRTTKRDPPLLLARSGIYGIQVAVLTPEVHVPVRHNGGGTYTAYGLERPLSSMKFGYAGSLIDTRVP